MSKKKNIQSYICAFLGTIYLMFLLLILQDTSDSPFGLSIFFEFLTNIILAPHFITVAIAVIFSWVGYCKRKPGSMLTASILYIVAALLYIVNVFFCIPPIVFGFIGYSKQKKSMKHKTAKKQTT